MGLIAAYARNALDDVLVPAMDVIMAFRMALVAVALWVPSWIIIVAIAPDGARCRCHTRHRATEINVVHAPATESMGVPRVRILSGELFPTSSADDGQVGASPHLQPR